MIVVDASVLANALTDDGPRGGRARLELDKDAYWAGPDHLLVELYSAIRGRWLGRKISVERAMDALEATKAIVVDRVDTANLFDRMWELRSNLSGYDAAYVAAAEAARCTLLTADSRLAGAPGITCAVIVADET